MAEQIRNHNPSRDARDEMILNHPERTADAKQPFDDFPWSELFERLGEAGAGLTDRDYSDMVRAFRELLKWVLLPGRIHIAGVRCFALAWVLDASIFDGTPSGPQRRIPTQIGHDSDFIRTAFQSISDTVPI